MNLEERLDEITDWVEDIATIDGDFKRSFRSFIAGVKKAVEKGYLDGYDFRTYAPNAPNPKKRSPDFRRGWKFGYNKAYYAGQSDAEKVEKERDEEQSRRINEGRDWCVHEIERRTCGECSHVH